MDSLFDKKEAMRFFEASSYLETSISELFFTSKFAYKIKKPVNLGFVDFTKRSERNRISKEEFRINKIISPSIYLALVPLGENKNSELAIKKQVKGLVEYAIKMIRLPADGCLTSLLSRKKVDEKIVYKLARKLSSCHQKLGTKKIPLKYGSEKTIKNNFENIFDLIRKDLDKSILSQEEFRKIEKSSWELFENNISVFHKRMAEKRIQRIHGDLHSENVFIKKRTPFITDATLPIPAWEYGDSAIDVGALTMDFDAYGLGVLSNILVSEYAKNKKDDSMKEVISFYKLYWALIRFWVKMAASQQGIKESRRKAQLYKKVIFKYLNIE